METDDNMEITRTVPETTMTIEDMLKMTSYPTSRSSTVTAPESKQHFAELTLFGQHEYLGDRRNFVPQIRSGSDPSRNIVQLCQRWGKLRAEEAQCERACLATERVEMAILDTGASKTVVGRENFRTAISQLDPNLRQQIRTTKSQTVFRFGNNGTLPSLFTAWVPFGKGQWFRIEVVAGHTPFLISNAFLRMMRCELDFSKNDLRIPEWQKTLKLEVNGKGLYQVSLRDLLEKGIEFVGLSESRERDERQSNSLHAPKRLGHSESSDLGSFQESNSARLRKDVLHGGDHGHGASLSRRRSPQHLRNQPRAHQQASGSSGSTPMGAIYSGGRQAQGKELPGSLHERSRPREVYRQSKAQADVEKSRVLPRLCTGNGDDEAPEDNNMEDESYAVEHGVGHTRRRDGHSDGAWPGRTSTGTSDAMFANAHDQQQLDGEEEPKGKRSSVMGDDCSDAQRGDRSVGSGAGTGTENSDRDPVKGAESSRGQEGLMESPSEQIVPLSQNQMQAIFAALEQTAGEIERSFCTEFLELGSKAGIDRDMRTFLQVDVGVEDGVGDAVVAYGGYRWKVHISRRDLRQSNYEHCLRNSIEKSRPRHIWLNVGLKDMTPSERQRVSELFRIYMMFRFCGGTIFMSGQQQICNPKKLKVIRKHG